MPMNLKRNIALTLHGAGSVMNLAPSIPLSRATGAGFSGFCPPDTSPTKRRFHRHPHTRNPAGTKAARQAKKKHIGLIDRGY